MLNLLMVLFGSGVLYGEEQHWDTILISDLQRTPPLPKRRSERGLYYSGRYRTFKQKTGRPRQGVW